MKMIKEFWNAWYYRIYLLMRIVCWFALGCGIMYLIGKPAGALMVGAIFAIIGGFFKGIYQMLVD